jgi:CubicO group peptidase (beta-lactamase class C family)
MRATPAEAGMSEAQLEVASQILNTEIDRGGISAATLLVTRGNEVVFDAGFGRLRPEDGAPAVAPDSIFLVASITKPVTAIALMLLVDRGLVCLDDPVSLYIPEFNGSDRKHMTVRQLLTHTSGMPDMLPENEDLRRAHEPVSTFVERAITTPLLFAPGTAFRYQSKGILLAAEIVQRVSGQALRDFEAEQIFAPLGMNRTALGLGSLEVSQTVWCSTTMEESEDDSSWGWNTGYWRDFGAPWGGMHTTTGDLAMLLQMMLNGGQLGGRRILSKASAEAMLTNQNVGLGAPWGIGWALSRAQQWDFCGTLVSPSTFGHAGATGTVAWADPERALSCVCLTNNNVNEGSLLRRVSNAVCAAVED